MNHQIRINTYGNVFIKIVLPGFFFMFKIINVYRMCHRIHNPIFSDTGGTVFKKLNAIIHLLGGGGDNLNNPVWRPAAASIVDFIFIAKKRNKRLHPGSVICV